MATPEEEEARQRDFDYVGELNRYIAFYTPPSKAPACVPIWSEITMMSAGEANSDETIRPLPKAADLGPVLRRR